jgi:hypothetical protein
LDSNRFAGQAGLLLFLLGRWRIKQMADEYKPLRHHYDHFADEIAASIPDDKALLTTVSGVAISCSQSTKNSIAPAPYKPVRHHFDRYADQIAATIEDHRLYKTPETAAILGCSPITLEAWRSKGWGPPYTKTSPRQVRYRGSDLVAYLRSRRIDPATQPAKRQTKRRVYPTTDTNPPAAAE